MKIKIDIMSGAGNIFSVLDNRIYKLTDDAITSNITKFCNNEFDNIITDGLITIEDCQDDLVNVKFFNPDGTSGMMCGNGARCCALYVKEKKILQTPSQNFSLSLAGNIYNVDFIDSGSIRIFFPKPKLVEQDVVITLKNFELTADFVDVNTPHILICFDELIRKRIIREEISFWDWDILDISKQVRYHIKFQPTGVNVNFYKLGSDNSVLLRTYEKGVERETFACGTGALSTAIITFLKHSLLPPITIIPKSQSTLYVNFEYKQNIFTNLSLMGEAKFLEEKEIEI